MTSDSDHLLWRLRNNDTAKHLCGLAADRIEALKREREWRPIESAPRDGTPVLVAQAGGRWASEARWIEDHGWYEANNDPTDTYGGPLNPTHWLPLPQPPEAK